MVEPDGADESRRFRAKSSSSRRVALYEINGLLFFGAAQKAMAALHAIRGDSYEVMILDFGKVPFIDSTGFVALENALDGLARRQKAVILAGPVAQAARDLRQGARPGEVAACTVAEDLASALASPASW